MSDSIGVKIELEGEKVFKSALSDLNAQFKVLGSEMKLVASQFDKNDDSVESLTARNEVLAIAQYALNFAMYFNPIGVIIVAIAALVAAIIALVKNWGTVFEALSNAWTALTGTKIRIKDIYGLEHVGAIELAMSDADSGCGEPCIGVDCDEILLKLSEIKAISIA